LRRDQWIVVASEVQEDLEREMANEEQSMPVVKHYEQRDYCGMFDYNKDEEMLLIKNLILGRRRYRVKFIAFMKRDLVVNRAVVFTAKYSVWFTVKSLSLAICVF
jgi:hypothetical protein